MNIEMQKVSNRSLLIKIFKLNRNAIFLKQKFFFLFLQMISFILSMDSEYFSTYIWHAKQVNKAFCIAVNIFMKIQLKI